MLALATLMLILKQLSLLLFIAGQGGGVLSDFGTSGSFSQLEHARAAWEAAWSSDAGVCGMRHAFQINCPQIKLPLFKHSTIHEPPHRRKESLLF